MMDQPRPKLVAMLAKERVVSVAAGSNHSFVLSAEGALFSFGFGAYGQLGHGDTANQLRPKRVAALAKERVVSMAAGGLHSLALTAKGAVFSFRTVEGTLFSFGRGDEGMLGHGDVAQQLLPKRVAE